MDAALDKLRTEGFDVRAKDVARLSPLGLDYINLNAGLAQWLIGTGRAPARYVAAQGQALGRAGHIHVDYDGSDFWIGGDCVTCIEGQLSL